MAGGTNLLAPTAASDGTLALALAVSTALVAGTLHHPPATHTNGYACGSASEE